MSAGYRQIIVTAHDRAGSTTLTAVSTNDPAVRPESRGCGLDEKFGQRKGVPQRRARRGIVEYAPRPSARRSILAKARPQCDQRRVVVIGEIDLRPAMTAIIARFSVTGGIGSPLRDRRIGGDPRYLMLLQPAIGLGRKPARVSRLDRDRYKKALAKACNK